MGFFPTIRKKNVIPVHKQGNNQSVSNYGPVSLLSIFSKKFKNSRYLTLFVRF